MIRSYARSLIVRAIVAAAPNLGIRVHVLRLGVCAWCPRPVRKGSTLCSKCEPEQVAAPDDWPRA